MIPDAAIRVTRRLYDAGFAAYLVGGCVRDLLLHRQPKDWDVATDATPRQVQRLFPRTRPTGVEHGTVTVVLDMAIEVTTFRTEAGYSDHRHPDSVEFVTDIEEDLARRDLTINALALGAEGGLIDPFDGIRDMRQRVIRAVGEPGERFDEDALRMMRVFRFAAELGFAVKRDTYEAAASRAPLLRHVSVERIRDEFVKAALSPAPGYAMELMRDTGLLGQFIPELLEGVGCAQNKHHRYTVWHHTLLAVDHTPAELRLRLAALLHDVAKPRTLSVDENGERHFYHHEVEGAKMTRKILRRLRLPNKTVERVAHLVRHHLALHHYPKMTDAAVRRLIRRVGRGSIPDLLLLRSADRQGSGTKQGPVSAGTRALMRRIEKVLREDAAFSLGDMAVDGHDVMDAAGIEPGPLVGDILDALFEEVLDDPQRNEPDLLRRRAVEMAEGLQQREADDGDQEPDGAEPEAAGQGEMG